MDALTTAPLKWLFERCVFEESTLELSVDGRLVDLERKPLEVLRHLLRHAGEVVTKEEIHASVWPGRVLSDTVLTKAVSRIREALGDDAQTLIKTVHGYGYRLIAPVSVETALARPSPVLGLKAGDSPPLRAQWRLEAHLGSGGSGEVWKVVHAKTGDVRVFKFAVDAEALNTLKREITLFRLVKQQLGVDAPIAEMLDWNLEEAPYFLELTHYHAGNLALWAAAQGGLKQIPLSARLAVFADIAAAVAVVHGVGVLHKDLKASNIFMRGEGLAVKPLLADFGGGGVMAEDVIANAGITRMGFTQLLDPAGQATTLYLAPEVLEGQPQTIQGDIYALGVLLYQMCVGDFRKPVSPGWEQGIADELLQRDIAEAVQGDPERRLSSAQALADRIRTLDARRTALAEQRRVEAEQAAAVAAAALARRKIGQLRDRRKVLLLVLGVMALGLSTSLWLYRQAVLARRDAEHSRAVAEAVSNFLNDDVLVATEREGRDTRNLTAQQLLDDAAKRVDARFADQPEAGARVHTALSSSFMQIGDTRAAIAARGRGWDIARSLQHSDPESALRLAVELAPVDFTRGEDLPFWLAMREVAERRWGRADPRTLLLRNAVALGESRQRQAANAAEAYAAIIQDAEKIAEYDIETLATHWEDLGQEQASLARFKEAEAAYQKAITLYAGLYGEGSFSAATAEIRYARLLLSTGRYAEAEAQLQLALKAGRAQRNAENALVNAANRTLAMLRTEQRRFDEAENIIAEVRRAELVSRGALSQQVVHAGYLLAALREAQGRHAEAEKLIRSTLEAQQAVPVMLLYGERRKAADRLCYQLLMVRVLALDGRGAEALAAFAPVAELSEKAGVLSDLDRAETLRARGLLLRAQGEADQAEAVLRQVSAIYQSQFGTNHPYSQRAEKELSGRADL